MRYRDLPAPRPDRVLKNGTRILAHQPILYCYGCGGEFSATPGDYWQYPRDAEIECGECGDPLSLVVKRTVYEEVDLDVSGGGGEEAPQHGPR